MSQDVDLCIAFYKAVKRRSFCLICHDTDNIEFHHISPADKLSEVTKVAKLGNLDLLKAEFNKTLPLCSRDHKAVHAGRIKGWLFGRTIHGKPSDAREAVKFMPFLDKLEVLEHATH